MVEEAAFCMIKSVGRVDENALAPHIQTPLPTSSFLEVKSIVHFQVGNNVSNQMFYNLRP
jgi:hypothetical protein